MPDVAERGHRWRTVAGARHACDHCGAAATYTPGIGFVHESYATRGPRTCEDIFRPFAWAVCLYESYRPVPVDDNGRMHDGTLVWAEPDLYQQRIHAQMAADQYNAEDPEQP